MDVYTCQVCGHVIEDYDDVSQCDECLMIYCWDCRADDGCPACDEADDPPQLESPLLEDAEDDYDQIEVDQKNWER